MMVQTSRRCLLQWLHAGSKIIAAALLAQVSTRRQCTQDSRSVRVIGCRIIESSYARRTSEVQLGTCVLLGVAVMIVQVGCRGFRSSTVGSSVTDHSVI
jgi:hypothetical protein